jgi:hypothetical protein
MLEPNAPAAVARIMRRLGDSGICCVLFGGWAEEIWGLCPPRSHGDIDLFLPADSFQDLDVLLGTSQHDLEEIALKRFPHKRAFRADGLMIEVVLVQQENRTAVTWFWGDVRFEWTLPLAEDRLLGEYRLPVASPRNLRRYRTLFRSTEPWRWRDPGSLVPRLP